MRSRRHTALASPSVMWSAFCQRPPSMARHRFLGRSFTVWRSLEHGTVLRQGSSGRRRPEKLLHSHALAHLGKPGELEPRVQKRAVGSRQQPQAVELVGGERREVRVGCDMLLLLGCDCWRARGARRSVA